MHFHFWANFHLTIIWFFRFNYNLPSQLIPHQIIKFIYDSISNTKYNLNLNFSIRLLSLYLFISQLGFSLSAKDLPLVNELGMIPIFTYHKISSENNLMNRKPSSLEKDLDYLRLNRYQLISVDEFYKGYIKVSLGSIPAILSFDDSHISQFKFIEKNKIDPNSAVGILENYKRKYPNFRITAIFFVTPCQRGQNELFGQKSLIQKKLNFLLENDYEIGNHSCSHPDFQKTDILKIQSDLNLSQVKIRKYLPKFKYLTLATPYGGYPKRKHWKHLSKSSNLKHDYNHKLVFSYSNRMSLSPFSKNYNNLRVSRIHGYEESLQSFRSKIQLGEWKPFISDGDPKLITIPKARKDELKIDSSQKLILAPNGKDLYYWKLN